MRTPFTFRMNILPIQTMCMTDLCDGVNTDCVTVLYVCMLMTCCTSYCLVTASGIYGIYVCMYVIMYVECCSILLTKPLTIDYCPRLTDQISLSQKAVRKIILATERLNFQSFRIECINFYHTHFFIILGE